MGRFRPLHDQHGNSIHDRISVAARDADQAISFGSQRTQARWAREQAEH